MKRDREDYKKKYPRSEVRESCIAGNDCDGICRDKHYKDCIIHAEYFFEYRGKHKSKIYVKENENGKSQNHDR